MNRNSNWLDYAFYRVYYSIRFVYLLQYNLFTVFDCLALIGNTGIQYVQI